MRTELTRLLQLAIDAQDPKLFFTLLCLYNYNRSLPQYVREFQGERDIRHRLISMHWDPVKIRSLVKKLTIDVGRPISLKCSGSWMDITLSNDFDIRHSITKDWIEKNVYVFSNTVIGTKPSTVKGLSDQDKINWYLSELNVE